MTGRKVKRKYLGRVMGRRAYEVDGAAVRRKHVAFMGGGNGYAYKYIPKGELWVEKLPNRFDERAIAHHEGFEASKMSKGWTYDRAHKAANLSERSFRRHWKI